jgi:hypothetical protein
MDMPQGSGAHAPHRGVLVLVLGILSIVFCQILGPFAWLMGKGDLAKINSGQMDPAGRDLTKAGMICGIIGSVLFVLGLVLAVLWVILVVMLGIGAAAAAGSGAY